MNLAAVLPPTLFDDLAWYWLVLIGAVSLYLVMKGADVLVDAAAQMALRLGMPKIVVGATIVSLGTTSPETAVSVIAAWTGKAGLALGNGVGSIIADTGLIFGIGAVMVALPAHRFVLVRQGWVQFGVAAFLAAWCYVKWAIVGDTAALGYEIGVVLLAMLVWYLWISVKWARQHTELMPDEPDLDVERVDEATHGKQTQRGLFALLGLGLFGLTLVIVGGDAAVQSASLIALKLGVPEMVLAATVVAFGTSVPELVIGITSIRKGHPELLVGNVIGADILNVLWVIGLSAIGGAIAGTGLPIVPDGNPIFLTLQLPTMLVMLVLFRIYISMSTGCGHFQRWMGIPLLVMYVAFIAAQYVMSL